MKPKPMIKPWQRKFVCIAMLYALTLLGLSFAPPKVGWFFFMATCSITTLSFAAFWLHHNR